jgi:hypothetical protein
MLKNATTVQQGSAVVGATTQLQLRYGLYMTFGLLLKGMMGL